MTRVKDRATIMRIVEAYFADPDDDLRFGQFLFDAAPFYDVYGVEDGMLADACERFRDQDNEDERVAEAIYPSVGSTIWLFPTEARCPPFLGALSKSIVRETDTFRGELDVPKAFFQKWILERGSFAYYYVLPADLDKVPESVPIRRRK